MSPRFSSGGLSTFDLLGDLSSSERTLTRIFLRNTELSENEIFAVIQELPENKRMDRKEMKAILKSLIEKGWLEEKRSGLKKVYALRQKKHRH